MGHRVTGPAQPLTWRSAGVVGLLERLIEDGCAEAVDSGTEKLTENLLDEITVNLGNDPTRDPAASEIPPVPPIRTAPAPRPESGRRPRNTAFDDPGVPATADPSRAA